MQTGKTAARAFKDVSSNKRKSRRDEPWFTEEVDILLKHVELSCRVAVICRFNRDLEDIVVAYHTRHLKGRYAEAIVKYAHTTFSANVNTWRSRGLKKMTVSTLYFDCSDINAYLDNRLRSIGFAMTLRCFAIRKTQQESNAPWPRSSILIISQLALISSISSLTYINHPPKSMLGYKVNYIMNCEGLLFNIFSCLVQYRLSYQETS